MLVDLSLRRPTREKCASLLSLRAPAQRGSACRLSSVTSGHPKRSVGFVSMWERRTLIWRAVLRIQPGELCRVFTRASRAAEAAGLWERPNPRNPAPYGARLAANEIAHVSHASISSQLNNLSPLVSHQVICPPDVVSTIYEEREFAPLWSSW